MLLQNQKNPIEIISYDLISCLGNLDDRISKLRKNVSNSVQVSMRDKIDGQYPYFKIDNNPRLNKSGEEISYIDKIVSNTIEQSGLTAEQLSKMGVFVGSSSNDSSIVEPLSKASSYTYNNFSCHKRVGAGYLAYYIQNKYNLNEITLTYNTACTSSSNALIDASTFIQGGVIDSALIIGIDLFSVILFEGFMSMRLLSEGTLKTFSDDADGIVLGEAVSAVIISKSNTQKKKNNTWYYRSGVNLSENQSLTGSNPSGSGFTNTINKALSLANIQANDITAIKLHGTATEHNDIAEANSLKSIYKNSQIPLLFGLKGYIGHTLGACGVAELVLLLNTIDEGFIPKTLNYNPNSVKLGLSPTQSNMIINNGIFQLNYVAFGGNNNTIIIEKTKSN